MNNLIHAKTGLQVIKKKKKGKKNRRGRGKRGKNSQNQEQNEQGNIDNSFQNIPLQNSQNNFFQSGNQQRHPNKRNLKNFSNPIRDQIRGPLTIDSLYKKYSEIDPSIVLNVFENNNNDAMLTDFQLKEMAGDIFGDNSRNKPPPDLQKAFNPFDDFEDYHTSPKLHKKISGMSTGLDENDSASYNDMNEFETPPLSKHSSSQKYRHQDEEYLNFLEEGYKGDDITKDDLTTIIKVIRKSIGEEEDIDGNAYILEQYMNDLVLVQSFIEKKLALQKEKNSSKSGVSIHSRKDFPTLGGGGKKKKGKFKPRKKKKGRKQEVVEKIETPFDRKKHKVVYETKQVDLISQIKEEREMERKRIDEERREKGIIGGFNLDNKGYKAARTGVQKSEWNMFQKDLFFTGGSSESQHIFFTLHSMFPRIMLGRLKVFYTQLGQNMHQTREFLMTEFPDYYRPGAAQLPNQGVQNPNFVKIGAAFNPQNDDADFGLEESKLRELKRMDVDHLEGRFQELRTKVRNLQKVYYLCSKHGKAARDKRDHTKANSLLNHRRKTEMSLGCMKEESVYIAYEICRRQGFKKLDLHGLYLEEAEEVVMLVINKIERMQRINRRSKEQRRNFYLEIVTGKGRHSKGKAVLFPKIKSYLESQKYFVKKSQDNGRIIVKL